MNLDYGNVRGPGSKKQTKNDNTTMSEQAKVGRKLKLQLWDQASKRSSRELRKAL